MKTIEKSLCGNLIGLIIKITYLVVFSTLFGWHCRLNKIVITNPIKAPVAISFIDANRLLSKQIPKVKVTLIDPGGMVVTSNNLSFSSLEIQGGVMSLGLKKEAVLDGAPYRFT